MFVRFQKKKKKKMLVNLLDAWCIKFEMLCDSDEVGPTFKATKMDKPSDFGLWCLFCGPHSHEPPYWAAKSHQVRPVSSAQSQLAPDTCTVLIASGDYTLFYWCRKRNRGSCNLADWK